MRLPAKSIAAAALGLGLLQAAPAQAGLLDFLFGGGGFDRPAPAPAPRYYGNGGSGAPLSVKVNPRRKHKPSGTAVAGSGRDRKDKRLARTNIDPVKHPNWYLEDPTLRRGDIVVLTGEVLVYEGGRGQATRADFTSLSKSNLVSKGERDRIKTIATNPADAQDTPKSAEGPVTVGKEAALKATE